MYREEPYGLRMASPVLALLLVGGVDRLERRRYNFPTRYECSEVGHSQLQQEISPCPTQRADSLIGSQIFIGNEETCGKLTMSRCTLCCTMHEVARVHTFGIPLKT